MTTIQISQELKEELQKRKARESETYEDVIWDLVEDRMALSAETLKELERSREEARNGETVSHETMMRELRERQRRLHR